MNSLPTSTSSTSASNSNMSATAAASGSSAAAAAGASHPSHANTRWKPASSAHSNVNSACCRVKLAARPLPALVKTIDVVVVVRSVPEHDPAREEAQVARSSGGRHEQRYVRVRSRLIRLACCCSWTCSQPTLVFSHEALLEETLAGLRGKARDLQNDKWMYEDVHI